MSMSTFSAGAPGTAGLAARSTLSTLSTAMSSSSNFGPPQSAASITSMESKKGRGGCDTAKRNISPTHVSLGSSSSSSLFAGRLKLPPGTVTASKTIRRRRSSGDKQDSMDTSDIHDNQHDHGYHTQLSSSFPSKSAAGLAAFESSSFVMPSSSSSVTGVRKKTMLLIDPIAKAQSREARKLNDSMVYLEGPQVYSCVECRTHLTTHDEIISKSFHGRRGRAYLFDNCVNVTIGPAQERVLMTGLHSVCDIFCKRCKTLVGWTYKKAYEQSQKYKEGKFIVEKINLHIEESDYYGDIMHPVGERKHRFRARSISWGRDDSSRGSHRGLPDVYEYDTSTSSTMSLSSSSDSRLDLP
mmetsp:Transcript_57453/g.140219  ORF Transcript_57453/g.140219 Transcript_57453/m.140219 type:complete len:355 (-) Transcript_57453:363-1427(-)